MRQFPGLATTVGSGPAYLAPDPVKLSGAPREDGYSVVRVVWVSAPEYAGPLTIRNQANAGAELLFRGEGTEATHALDLPAEAWAHHEDQPEGSREWPAYLLVPGPGCYLLEVQGDSFVEPLSILAER
jgi:hypothetical protein